MNSTHTPFGRTAAAALAALLLAGAAAGAQTAPATAPATTTAAATQPAFVIPPADVRFEYASKGWAFPPSIPVNQTRPRTVDLLGQALAASAGTQRLQYIQEIGLCRLASGIPYIRPHLADADPNVKAQTIHSLGLIGPDAASLLPNIVGIATRAVDDAQIRREALLAVLSIEPSGPTRSAALATALGDKEEIIVITALRNAEGAHVAAVAGLLAAPTSSMMIKAEAIGALARLQAAAHVPAIAAFLAPGAPVGLQQAAIKAVADLRAAAQLPAVVALLAHRHPTIRREALQAVAVLAGVADRQAHALKALEDPDPTVRQAAATIFIAHPDIRAVELLATQLNDTYVPLHHAAREALVVPDTAEMKQACIVLGGKLLYDANLRRVEDGSYILGKLKSDHEIDRHVALLAAAQSAELWQATGVDWGVVTQAAWSLGWIGNRKAVPPIVPLLRRAPNSALFMNGISEATAEALFVAAARFELKDALSEVKRILYGGKREDQQPQMRAAATFALGRLNEAGDGGANGQLVGLATFQPEGPLTRAEAIKALVARQAKSAVGRLDELARTDTDPVVRGMAHWARQELTGQSLPYTPPDLPWDAMVSIRDVSK